MSATPLLRLFSRMAAIAAVSLVVGCSGGGGGGAIVAPALDGIIGGTGIKGPVSNATVTAYAITGGQIGSQIGTTTTHADGSFTMSIGNYGGPLMVQMSGGTYTDEASGATMSMAGGDVMTAMLTNVAANSTVNGIQVTPLTSMAQRIAQNMTGGMTDANIASAHAAVGNYFMVSDVLHTMPMNVLVTGSGGGGTTQDMKNYGMVLAAMSQSARNLGMTSSSAFATAMMNDAADGVMNGRMGSSAVMMGGMTGASRTMPTDASTIGLADAMVTFMNSAQNRSGVTSADMQALMNRLRGSSGVIVSDSSLPAASGMISGMAVKGPVAGATVSAYAIMNGQVGHQLGTTTTDASGNFTMPIGDYAGSVMLKLMGGTFTDEATGITMPMADGDVMTAVMTGITKGGTVTGMQLTPLTSMAQAMANGMAGGMINANIDSANAAVGMYFSVDDILRTMPMNPLVAGSGVGATRSMMNYGIALAAMSQDAKNQGLSSSSAFVTAMMNDAADGMMNGMNGTNQIGMGGVMGAGMNGGGMMSATAGTFDLGDAMTTFMNSSANKSGLTAADMQALIQQMMGSSGVLHP